MSKITDEYLRLWKDDHVQERARRPMSADEESFEELIDEAIASRADLQVAREALERVAKYPVDRFADAVADDLQAIARTALEQIKAQAEEKERDEARASWDGKRYDERTYAIILEDARRRNMAGHLTQDEIAMLINSLEWHMAAVKTARAALERMGSK